MMGDTIVLVEATAELGFDDGIRVFPDKLSQ